MTSEEHARQCICSRCRGSRCLAEARDPVAEAAAGLRDLASAARANERARIVAWLRKKAHFLGGQGGATLAFTASALEAGSLDIEEREGVP